jgi:hypothetical protein
MSYGWMSFRVESKEIQYDINGSDALNDPLLDLLNATIRLRRGECEVYIEFWNEPNSCIWRLEKSEIENRLYVHLYYSQNSSPVPFITHKHLDEYHFEYKNTVETDLDSFTDQVINLFDQLLAHYGAVDYKNHWYEFPSEPLDLLKELRCFSRIDKPELYLKRTMKQNELTIEDIVDGSYESEIQDISLHNDTLTITARLPYFGQFYSSLGEVENEITVCLKITSNHFHVNFPVQIRLSF